jgi:hypothetical protein
MKRPVLLFCIALLAGCGQLFHAKHAPPVRYEIPADWDGWVIVEWAVPGAPALPEDGDTLVVAIPRSGTLKTSTPFYSGVRHDSYVAGTQTSVPWAAKIDDHGPFTQVTLAGGVFDETYRAGSDHFRQIYFFHVGRGAFGEHPDPPSL